MGFSNLSKACALLLATSIGVEASAAAQHAPNTHKILRAATKREDLYRRDVRIRPKFNAELAYIEAENGWNGGSIFASNLKVASKKPILNLEEIEHHLTDVRCGDGVMKLSFVDDVSAIDARRACDEKDGGLIITSHESCNHEGERAVYKVRPVTFADDGTALELAAVQSLWDKAFDHFEVDFGHTSDDHLFRRHSDFAKIRRRQAAASSASVTVPPISIPTDSPDNVNQVKFDLSWQVQNKTFKPEDFTGGLPADLVPLPDLSNVPIEVGCKKCSTKGGLLLSQGSIVIDPDQIDVVPDILEGGDDGKSISSVITGGFLEVQANDVEGSFELFARPKSTGNFKIQLFELPILGFVIPGVGQAGAAFTATLSADYDIQGGFEIDYGMNITVPNNSSVRMELSDITQSNVTGFPDTKLTPLPFNFDQKDVSARVSLALIPSVPIGFKFEESINATVSLNMDLPRLDALISTVANADTNCKDQGNSTPASTNSSQIGSLVLIQANVSISADVGFEVKFPALPQPFDGTSIGAQIFSTVFPLSSQCLAPLSGFQPATDVYGAAPTSGAAGPSVTGSFASSTCISSTTTVYLPPAATGDVSLPPYANGTASQAASSATVSIGTVMPSVTPSGTSPPPEQFSSAAAPMALPEVRWARVGWQMSLVGLSFGVGMLVL